MSEELDKIEQYQRLFIQPMIDTVKSEFAAHLKPVSDAQTALDKRLDAAEAKITYLQSILGKALVGFTVISVATGSLVGLCLNWIKKKLHLG